MPVRPLAGTIAATRPIAKIVSISEGPRPDEPGLLRRIRFIVRTTRKTPKKETGRWVILTDDVSAAVRE